MKKLVLLASLMLSFSCFSIEYKPVIKCKGNYCKKEVEITGVKEPKMQFANIEQDQCYFDFSTSSQNPIVYKVMETSPQKLTILKMLSKDEKNYINVYERSFIWKNEWDRRDFKKISCTDTDEFYLVDKLNNCLKNKRVYSKVYCDMKQ